VSALKSRQFTSFTCVRERRGRRGHRSAKSGAAATFALVAGSLEKREKGRHSAQFFAEWR